ncbi:hypothetical protein Droror1_Dr00013026 [Drosera rotundifolia]
MCITLLLVQNKMGEEAKPEQAPAEAKAEEKAKDKKEEAEPQPPSPVVLAVDLHCVGCAKKIERSIMRAKGVEEVVIDMGKNQVIIRGTMDPQAVCDKITKRTKRKPKLLSPLPPPPADPAPEPAPAPESATPQAPVMTTVELNVNMHCEACSEQLKRKILQMKGVQTAQTELSTGKVVVTGTMDAEKLVEYVYRRTKKQAKIVPQPEPEKLPEEKKDGEKSTEEPKAEDKKDDNVGQKEGEKPPEEVKKEGGENASKGGGEEAPKEGGDGGGEVVLNSIEDESLKRMIYYYQPLYVIERIPPPQLFSDENPNACCIS